MVESESGRGGVLGMDGSAEERQNLLIGRKRSGAGAMTSARRKGECLVSSSRYFSHFSKIALSS